MSDPIHAENRPAHDEAVDRHARIEDLLIAGLDHYFRGDYDQAIHVWTRVLFLDRGHTRARAYIERARGAAAERQRESEELLHEGVAAFDRGDVNAARRLLSSAVERGGPHDVALALLDRLDRLSGQPGPEPRRESARRRRALLRRRQAAHGREAEQGTLTSFWLVPMALVAIGITATVVLSLQPGFATSFPWPRTNTPPAAIVEEPLPVISPSEAALGRARILVARGRLHEALRVLETVRRGDPVKADADALRAAVQRAILTDDGKAAR
jgi:tetratricopeptide (TPR) repeat protein